MMIELPWPPASLSGHNNGNRWAKASIVAKHREWAYKAAMGFKGAYPGDGDICVSVTFYAPNNSSDRLNYWNRCKPYFDGIAQGLGVNDKRFLPSGYNIGENVKGGNVVVVLS
jgi:crossover junction endodeoxyribonuclease RusA